VGSPFARRGADRYLSQPLYVCELTLPYLTFAPACLRRYLLLPGTACLGITQETVKLAPGMPLLVRASTGRGTRSGFGADSLSASTTNHEPKDCVASSREGLDLRGWVCSCTSPPDS